ncbi:MAG TPA: NAD(P)/FAD-dependent oxidoreductase [Solirubrobacteraceae bacterium]|nr:NAD(P)/FAD-dependent oxidoreductase [Solirubrobacteraceae bacterium]
MSDSLQFDVVVLGAGPAGEVCAGRLAEADLSVALVERELVGGECSYYACMPSKGLLRPAQALAEARRVSGAAEAASGRLDVAAVLTRRDEIVHGLEDSAQMPWVQDHGIELFRGEGELVGERLLRVGDRTLRARRAIVLAPGTRAGLPPIPGLEQAAPWTNREATTSKTVPDSLLVLGGGVVAVELAQAYATLGAQVTLFETLERLISREEPFASELLQQALETQGVQVELGVKAIAVRRGVEAAGSEGVGSEAQGSEALGSTARADGAAGRVTLDLRDGRSFEAEQLLVAVGREPRTEDLGLDSVGLDTGGYIEVDEQLRVPGKDWLYVVGDANGRVLLTHMGKYQARLVADAILGEPSTLRSDGALSPRVIFTEPQIAAVGHTLASARAEGLSVRAVDHALDANAGASFVAHGAPGTARLVIDNERSLIVGATFCGVDVAEFLHAATIAMIGEVPLERLAHAVPCFPTRSEVWLGLLQKALQ